MCIKVLWTVTLEAGMGMKYELNSVVSGTNSWRLTFQPLSREEGCWGNAHGTTLESIPMGGHLAPDPFHPDTGSKLSFSKSTWFSLSPLKASTTHFPSYKLISDNVMQKEIWQWESGNRILSLFYANVHVKSMGSMFQWNDLARAQVRWHLIQH